MTINPFSFSKGEASSYPFVSTSTPKRRLRHVVFWLICLTLLILMLNVIKTTTEAFGRGATIVVCSMAIFYGSRFLINRYYEKQQYVKWLTCMTGLLLVVAAFRLWIDLEVLHAVVFQHDHIEDHGFRRTCSLYIFFLLVGILLMTLSSLYNIAKNRLSLEQQHYKLKLQHVETQLGFLKAQVNPHFLFNTLNNIYAATELKNPNAGSMILQLSQLLRYITHTVKHKTICLAEEWEQVENYVQLFCSKNPYLMYPVELKAEGDLYPVKIPPMLLLPLVENALKYSDIHEQPGDAFLQISLRCSAAQLQFQVINTYTANNQQQAENGGLGNPNIHQRLQLEYPDRFILHTEKESRFFTATLTISL